MRNYVPLPLLAPPLPEHPSPAPHTTHLSAECVEEAAECPEDEQVAQDDGLNARPLHLDSNLLTTVTQHSLVHLYTCSNHK
jgi:hypothetical protein